jgi:hypothetical protein
MELDFKKLFDKTLFVDLRQWPGRFKNEQINLCAFETRFRQDFNGIW